MKCRKETFYLNKLYIQSSSALFYIFDCMLIMQKMLMTRIFLLLLPERLKDMCINVV